MEDTLWALLQNSHVILDIPNLNLIQGLANFQECGINKHQYATKVN